MFTLWIFWHNGAHEPRPTKETVEAFINAQNVHRFNFQDGIASVYKRRSEWQHPVQ